jgi:hypothetical protein
MQMQRTELSSACEGLLFRILQNERGQERGFVVALFSPNPGAGVTQITNALVEALCRDRDGFAISLCGRQLKNANSWHGRESLFATLHAVRHQYPYALIDCGSLAETHAVVRLAPLVDGVILVVEANRTQKEQILYAERTIEGVNGRILGHVLNKRTYAIPDWCHRVMTSVGL